MSSDVSVSRQRGRFLRPRPSLERSGGGDGDCDNGGSNLQPLSQQQPVATSLLHQSQPQQQQQQQQHEEDGESDWAGSDVDSFMQGRYVHPDDPAFPFEDDEDELYVGGALDDLDELFDGIDSAGMAGGGWLHPAPGSSAAGGGQAGGMYISAPPPLPDAQRRHPCQMPTLISISTWMIRGR